MPPPGSTAPARIVQSLPDPIWNALYATIETAVDRLATAMNALQFLTIRRYLSFVFLALVGLLLALTIWQ